MSTAAAPPASKQENKTTHIWTGSAEEEDRVETLIKKSGCWDIHLKVSDCMGEHRDWRKCQDVVKEFRTCVQSVRVEETQKVKSENDFDLSDDENQAKNLQKTPCYPPFIPNLHNKFWYRSVTKENQTSTTIAEIDLFNVADSFDNGNFEEAERILTNLRETMKNNRTHEIMLIDSLLQCYIKKSDKLSSSEISTCLHLVSDYESLLADFGDQIQFLRTKAFLLAKMKSAVDLNYQSEFRKTMALLCQLCGSFDNWQIFEFGSEFFSNLELYGLKMKIKKILNYEIENSKGFVKEKLKKKLENVEANVKMLEMILKKDDINSIQSSLNSHKDTVILESVSSSDFRAHESRSKNKMIPVAEQPDAIADFFRRFPFLLS